jgi:hypothetical protein
MKKIKNILFSVLTSSVFIAITSCSGGIGDNLPGGDTTLGPVIIGWGQPAVTESYFSDIGTLNNLYPLVITGGSDGSPTVSDIVVTLSVDTANSTAVEGNEFTFPSSSVTIPAGTTVALVPININTGGFNATAPTQVVVNAVTTSGGVVVSSAAQKLVIKFVGCQSSLASYTYLVHTVGRGKEYGPVLETITETSVNSFTTYSVGYWGFSPFNIGNGVKFNDICGTLSVAKQDLADYYSNEVGPIGTSTVDENGNFELNYYISLSGLNVPMKGTYIRQ